MPVRWTREERRKYIRRKYFRWKQKLFAMAASFFFVFLTLYIAIAGFSGNVPLEAVSALLVGLAFFVVLMLIWGGAMIRSKITVLFISLIILVALLTLWAAGLAVLERLAVSIVVGLLFLLIVGVAVFFVDLTTYESG